MRFRSCPWLLSLLCGFVVLLAGTALGQVDPGTDRVLEPDRELARRLLTLIDLVLDRHVDPPTRQEMLLAGIKSAYRQAGKFVPSQISRRISDLSSSEHQQAFLQEVMAEVRAAGVSSAELEAALLDGSLEFVPGGASWVSDKEYRVQEQLRGNRYVGIGIALGLGKDERQLPIPKILEVFPKGSAAQAGIQKDDEFLSIEGQETAGMELAKVVDLLRGVEGSSVTATVRTPPQTEARKVVMRRSVVPFVTAVGIQKLSDDTWSYHPDFNTDAGFVRIASVRASTLQELRKLESMLAAAGTKALVLDLRGNGGGNFHDTLLLADALLPACVIGRVREAQGEQPYESSADCLFRDWPMAVLIDGSTARDAEWLAAALQDGRGAILVGEPTAAQGYVDRWLPLSEGTGAVSLRTGVLHRANGRCLLGAAGTSPELAELQGKSVTYTDVAARKIKATNPASVQPDEPISAARGPDAGDPALAKALECVRRKLKRD